jgi:hypothetical protein
MDSKSVAAIIVRTGIAAIAGSYNAAFTIVAQYVISVVGRVTAGVVGVTRGGEIAPF